MIKSMTGYGIAQFENDQWSISVEIKTLNSKFLDIATKLPKEVSSIENELRKIISDQLVRGKISLSIDISFKSENGGIATINNEAFSLYKEQMKESTKGMQLHDSDLIRVIMNLPDVLEKNEKVEESIDLSIVRKLTSEAAEQCDVFRIKEGLSIDKAMKEFGNKIYENLSAIKERDPDRVENIKTRINESLSGVSAAEKIDPNRFEQEIIYYLEKLDITEEFVRLENHIEFFQETLGSEESQGKKLGFISQEMGREINTIGSKANDSDIQKLVVEMKDELEKIKEQVLNIV